MSSSTLMHTARRGTTRRSMSGAVRRGAGDAPHAPHPRTPWGLAEAGRSPRSRGWRRTQSERSGSEPSESEASRVATLTWYCINAWLRYILRPRTPCVPGRRPTRTGWCTAAGASCGSPDSPRAVEAVNAAHSAARRPRSPFRAGCSRQPCDDEGRERVLRAGTPRQQHGERACLSMRYCSYYLTRDILCPHRCPRGLRGWTQVPIVSAAWVQIPLYATFFSGARVSRARLWCARRHWSPREAAASRPSAASSHHTDGDLSTRCLSASRRPARRAHGAVTPPTPRDGGAPFAVTGAATVGARTYLRPRRPLTRKRE